jgi:FMN hydrolase / 5-amino-6-(5-phospho-D-ribitylamino)uracil phosphatase
MDTLVRDPFRDVMPAFFGMTLTEMMQLKHPEAWGQFERGELSEPQFLSGFFADRRRFDHAGFCAAIRNAYVWLDGMQPLLARLAAQGHAMHVLSNYPVWYGWIEERLQLSRYVTWSFVSCRIGLRKPDPAIFWRVARELQVAPDACLFIDDRAKNCDAARAVGMKAVQFRGSAELLARDLEPLLPPQQART